MSNLGNPFFWGFIEQRGIETLAKRAKATYNTPAEGVDKTSTFESFFTEGFGHSPNPAFITGATALEQMPYTMPTSSSTESSDDSCEEDNEDIDTPSTDSETTTDEETPTEETEVEEGEEVTE